MAPKPTRTVTVTVRLTRAELRRLQAEARAADRPVASLIRRRALSEAAS